MTGRGLWGSSSVGEGLGGAHAVVRGNRVGKAVYPWCNIGVAMDAVGTMECAAQEVNQVRFQVCWQPSV